MASHLGVPVLFAVLNESCPKIPQEQPSRHPDKRPRCFRARPPCGVLRCSASAAPVLRAGNPPCPAFAGGPPPRGAIPGGCARHRLDRAICGQYGTGDSQVRGKSRGRLSLRRQRRRTGYTRRLPALGVFVPRGYPLLRGRCDTCGMINRHVATFAWQRAAQYRTRLTFG